VADPGTIRGLTPAQIKDVLALFNTPSMITIVTVPAGACVLVAQGAAIAGAGSGGTAQEYVAGIPSGPDCQGLQFLPASDYINRQPIGAFALLYGPHAGGGNAGAVAAALDHGPYPAPFTDMDIVYKSLDLLNFGDPAPLRAALVQLDGEVYADFSSVAIGAGQLLLGAVRDRARAATKVTGPVQQWLSVIGGAVELSGNGDSHDFNSRTAGLVGGIEHRFDPSLLAGIAFGYANSGFNTRGISGSGTADTFAITPYARYAPGRWYVEAAIGAAYNDASVSRDIVFPGQSRSATGDPSGWAFLSQVETGYYFDLDARTVLKPFAAIQGIVFRQGAFTETGAGAVSLNVDGDTTGSALGILGAELVYGLPVGLAAPLQLSGRLGWAHELADTQRTATAFFQGVPGTSFTVDGASVPRDTALFGLGMTLAMPAFNLFARYDGSAGGGSTIQGGSAGVRLVF
jgi:outer membrane autotransporter protein